MLATIVYMIDQVYVFRPGTIFNLIHDTRFYTDSVKTSVFYNFVIKYQDVILPLGIMLMLYKILLSNIINAALLSVWYNLLNIGFYKKKEDTSYRVEFHEVGGNAHDHNDG